jgi:hypothetical protein
MPLSLADLFAYHSGCAVARVEVSTDEHRCGRALGDELRWTGPPSSSGHPRTRRRVFPYVGSSRSTTRPPRLRGADLFFVLRKRLLRVKQLGHPAVCRRSQGGEQLLSAATNPWNN